MDYSKLSDEIKKTVPELTTIQRVVFAKNIADMTQYHHSDFSPDELRAITRFLNITGQIDRSQRGYLMGLTYDAEKTI